MKLKQLFQTYYKLILSQYNLLMEWISIHRIRLEKRGKAHFTFMLIPHSEQEAYKISISYNKITAVVVVILGLTFLSAIVVLGFSGKTHQVHEMEISNEDFENQKAKLELKLKQLHQINSIYYHKISSLYLKLGGNPDSVYIQDDNETKYSYLEPQTDIFHDTYQLNTDVYNLKLANNLTKEIIKIIKDKNKTIQSTPSLWPTKGYILFPFGKYFSPISGTDVINNGIDIGTYAGSEVVATAPGTAYETGFSESTGFYIKISHKYGWKTIYSNLERIQIKKNQQVSKGEILGYVGKSVTSPVHHLHYEVHVGTSPLNPYSFLNQIQN